MSNQSKQRRIILDLAITLDGYIEGKHGEVDWCIMDPDMGFTSFLNEIDTILYGRKSYDAWGQYVPQEAASEEEKELWRLVHSKEKYVFSKTQTGPNSDATFLNDPILEAVTQLKEKPGKDIWLYGGSSIITSFMNLGLIDEFRLSIHPIILGEGKPLFIDIKQTWNVSLVSARTFSSGVVQLIYRGNQLSQ